MYYSCLAPREPQLLISRRNKPVNLGTPRPYGIRLLLTWMVKVSRHPVYDMKGLGHCHLLLSSPYKVWQCPQTHLSLQVAVLYRRKATPGPPMITNTIWSVGLAQTTALGPQRSWSFSYGQDQTLQQDAVSCMKLWPTLTSTMKATRTGFNLEKRLYLGFQLCRLMWGPYVSLETAAHMCLPAIGCLCFIDSS